MLPVGEGVCDTPSSVDCTDGVGVFSKVIASAERLYTCLTCIFKSTVVTIKMNVLTVL